MHHPSKLSSEPYCKAHVLVLPSDGEKLYVFNILGNLYSSSTLHEFNMLHDVLEYILIFECKSTGQAYMLHAVLEYIFIFESKSTGQALHNNIIVEFIILCHTLGQT